MQDVDAQPRIDELVGKKIFILVGEFGPQVERTGGGIDLAVERPQFALAQFDRSPAVECRDWQDRPPGEAA